jgi:hypothetical protein
MSLLFLPHITENPLGAPSDSARWSIRDAVNTLQIGSDEPAAVGTGAETTFTGHLATFLKEVARFSHIASVRRRMKVELRLDFDVATLSIFEQSQLDQSGHGISGPTLGTGTAAVSQYEQTRFAMRQRQVLGYPPRERPRPSNSVVFPLSESSLTVCAY